MKECKQIFWLSHDHPEQGQMQEQQDERPAVPQCQSIAAATQRQGEFVADDQNPLGSFNIESSHLPAGSFDAQSSTDSNTASCAGGAFPVTASPHASVNNTPKTASTSLPPSRLQHFKASTSDGTATAQTTAKTRPTAPSLTVDRESMSSSHRHNVTVPRPAQSPDWRRKPDDGSGGKGSIKPVLKMKRIGQNFPLSLVGSSSPFPTPASLHQRNSSYSALGRSTSGLPVTSIPKASNPLPDKATGSSLSENKARSQVSKPLDTGVNPGLPSKAPASSRRHRPSLVLPGLLTRKIANLNHKYGESPKRSNARSSKQQSRPESGLNQTRGASDAEGGGDLSSSKLKGLSMQIGEGPNIQADQDSDDEIRYETAANGTGLDDTFDLDEVAEDNSSNDDTDSASDDDETAELQMSSPNGDTYSSLRQMFLPPEETDFEDDESGEDDATSVSSSAQSSLAAEPTAALPSANIQHEIGYPDNILEMATPDRAYVSWSDETVSFQRSGGALFPQGYEKCTEIPDHPWICPVRSCRLVYKTHLGLLNHFKFTHQKAMFNDNMDGTLSLVGSYTRKNESGKNPPVVVSRRPIDPKEPPMLEPSIPLRKYGGKNASTSLKTTLTAPGLDGEGIPVADLDTVSSGPLQNSSPPGDAHPGNSEKMWEYIRPFLTVHTSIPVNNWVKHVIHLPRVRDLKWNEERNKDRPYRDTHPRDITALIVYVTGVEAPTPCTYCAEGKGPLVGCILISPEASEEAKARVLSCANCYYHCYQSQCSHKRYSIYLKEKRVRDSQQMRGHNLRFLPDKAADRALTPAQSRVSLLKSPNTALSAMPSPPSMMRLFEPSEINNNEMASQDRTYKVIHGKNGMIQMHGALIPDKYDLDRSVPGYPWICPVRSCRLVHKRIVGLGSHFVAKHHGCLFNDNLDGTLSQVGVYDKPVVGFGCPPLVISKNPLDKTESPMEKARVLNNKASKPVKIARQLKHAPLAVVQPKEHAKTTDDVYRDAKKLWNYMLPYLPQDVTTVFDARVLRTFNLPRVRSIQWRKTWLRRSLEDDWRQVAGLLIHLVGVEYSGPVKCCTFCRRGQGPFEGCQVLPPEAPYESYSLLRSCANCLFIHRRDHCSTKSSWEKRCGTQPGTAALSAPPIAEWAAASSLSNVTNTMGSGQNNKRPYSEVFDHDEEGPQASRRRSERKQAREPEPEAGSEPIRRPLTLPLLSKEEQTEAADVLSAGQQTRGGFLEMEEWEIAPGRIREAGVGKPNDIAFSKSYLETNQMVRISPELSFRVETVKSGRTLDFEAEKAKTRYCSVASGKLRVTLEGQPEFTIGTHGVFTIKPGVKGRVQNRLYMDSVLHVSALESEG